MARLEYVNFKHWRENVDDRTLTWTPDKIARPIDRLPQIFWANGEGWAEVNHWALEKASNRTLKIDSIKSLMKHLHAYADFLEARSLDWRHFPLLKSGRTIVLFRGYLLESIQRGDLASSTARARMSAVIQFYRHADIHGFITTGTSMWQEKSVVIPYYDLLGFKRGKARVLTDLAIPNRRRPGTRIEDGLMPLSEAHMMQLLDYTLRYKTQEIHLMLTTGFYTGARLGTITSLKLENLEQAVPDPYMSGFFLLRVGPRVGVATKFDVEGDLLVPDFLLAALKEYAYSTARLKREVKARDNDRHIIFLTTRSRRYTGNSVDRLMTDLRRDALQANLKFMARFRFHQTRATYGTWLMKLALGVTSVPAAIEFVKNAMLHKHESATFSYIRFIETNRGKQEVAEAFNRAFTGIGKRNWDHYNA